MTTVLAVLLTGCYFGVVGYVCGWIDRGRAGRDTPQHGRLSPWT